MINIQETMTRVQYLKVEISNTNLEITRAEKEYTDYIQTLDEMGIENTNPNKVDLSDRIKECQNKSEMLLQKSNELLEKANAMLTELHGKLEEARK
jgi:chromosome segregation ATPase